MYWLRKAENCLRVCAKFRTHIILRMHKVSSGHSLPIHTFCSVQWFCYRTVKALIRLHGRAGWSEPSLSAYARRHVFAHRGPYDITICTWKLHLIFCKSIQVYFQKMIFHQTIPIALHVSTLLSTFQKIFPGQNTLIYIPANTHRGNKTIFDGNVFDVVFCLTYTILWENLADKKLIIFLSSFPSKLTSHGNCLQLPDLSNPVF